MKLLYVILPFLFFIACTNRNTPQGVTEDFIYNYYKLANQDTALKLSAGRASEKLENEIDRVKKVRTSGNIVSEMPKISYQQTGTETSEIEGVTHEFFNYKLTIKNSDGATTHTRNVVITTENIEGQWKVVNFDEY